MLVKYFTAAALLLTTALSNPLRLTIDVSDDSLSNHVDSVADIYEHVTKHKKHHLHGMAKDIAVSVKISEHTYEAVKKVKAKKPASVLAVIGGVYAQYKKLEDSTDNLPTELPEKNATEAVDAFYYLTEAFKSEFDLVVEKKTTLQEHDVLSVLLHDMIVYFNNEYAKWNDGLYGLLPTDALKEDFTDYSTGAALSISNALDALAPAQPGKLSIQKELK